MTTTILRVIAGSRAYGTNVEGSDTDYRGVFVYPRTAYLGIYPLENNIERKEPDTMLYELRHFIRLAGACNPHVMEVLYSKDVEECTGAGAILRVNRALFLTKLAARTFGGLAFGQLNKVTEIGGRKDWKYMMHAVRALRMVKEVLLDGEVIVRRPDAAALLDIRAGNVPLQEIKDWAAEQKRMIPIWAAQSQLPAAPDLDGLNNLCVDVLDV